MPGRIHYSFKGPALVGQSLTQNATQNTLPAQPGMVDIDFPCRFTERPAFTYGFEHAENAAVDALVPMVASVVSWRQGRRDETGLAFYDGARILITAPSVAAAAAASGGTEVLAVHWNDSEVGVPSSSAAFSWEYAIHNNPTSISWSQTDRSTVNVLGDGIIFVHAKVLVSVAPSANKEYLIKDQNYAFGHALLPNGVSMATGGGFQTVEGSVTPGAIRLTNDASAVTPTTAEMIVVFYPNGFMFQGS